MNEALFWAIFSMSGVGASSQMPALPSVSEVLVVDRVPMLRENMVRPVLENGDKLAVLVVDKNSGKVLYERNKRRVQYIASISKIATVGAALQENNPNEIVTIRDEATRIGWAGIDLMQEEQITLKTLVEAALIPSANDAATAIAQHVSGSTANHAEKMTHWAEELGLENTTFLSVTGLDIQKEKPANADENYDPDHDKNWTGNKSTAVEVAAMARILLRDEWLRDIVDDQVFRGASVDGVIQHEKWTTNKLLGGSFGVAGVKTGYTELAGQCVVTSATSPQGQEVLVVVLGAEDRFDVTRKVLSWVYDSYW